MLVIRSHSLRTRLLWFLLVPIVLAGVVQSYMAYHTALDEADEIFDYHMQQMALALRSGLPVSAAGSPVSPRNEEENMDFVVQVWAADGVRIFESSERAELPQLAVLGFSTVNAHGTTYRTLSMQTQSGIIQVAQDMAVRREIARRLALRTALPVTLMAPLLMFLVWWVVSQSLRPVARVRHQVAERQANDLSPVDAGELPDEIRPLVEELNLLFQRLRQAFQAQQHFVADAAHELRSPLAALKLQIQGLQRAVSTEARDLAVARLTTGIDRATHLIEQLLTLARQEADVAAGKNTEPVLLAEIGRLALVDTQMAAQERQIDLGLSHADEVSINGYPEALHILIRNLLENAVKFSPSGGSVDLEIRATDAGVELTVDDSGPGIPVEDQERVLDRFYRVHGSQSGGSGLGLAIVKSIADLHGASLTLQTSSRLGGLRAVVQFPALN